MSVYIDWSDVANRYADAAKIAGGSEAMKSNWINGAEAEIDARLALRYTVPFSPVPVLIKDIAADLAYWRMVMNREKPPMQLIASVNSRLGGLADGTLVLTISGTLTGYTDQMWSTTKDFPSAVGVDDPVKWKVSSAWQAANEAGRD